MEELNEFRDFVGSIRTGAKKILQSIGKSDAVLGDCQTLYDDFEVLGGFIQEFRGNIVHTTDALQTFCNSGHSMAFLLQSASSKLGSLVCDSPDPASRREERSADNILLQKTTEQLYSSMSQIQGEVLQSVLHTMEGLANRPMTAEDRFTRETHDLIQKMSKHRLAYEARQRSSSPDDPKLQKLREKYEFLFLRVSEQLKQRNVVRCNLILHSILGVLRSLVHFFNSSKTLIDPLAALIPQLSSSFRLSDIPQSHTSDLQQLTKKYSPVVSHVESRQSQKPEAVLGKSTVPTKNSAVRENQGGSSGSNHSMASSNSQPRQKEVKGDFQTKLPPRVVVSAPDPQSLKSTVHHVSSETKRTSANLSKVKSGILLNLHEDESDTHSAANSERSPPIQQDSDTLGIFGSISPGASAHSPEPSPLSRDSGDAFGFFSDAPMVQNATPTPVSSPFDSIATAQDLESLLGGNTLQPTKVAVQDAFGVDVGLGVGSKEEYAISSSRDDKRSSNFIDFGSSPAKPINSPASPSQPSVSLEIIEGWTSRGGRVKNLRSLLSSLDEVLWPNSGWRPVNLADLVDPAKVREAYRLALTIVHPDKVADRYKDPAHRIFEVLHETYNTFKKEVISRSSASTDSEQRPSDGVD